MFVKPKIGNTKTGTSQSKSSEIVVIDLASVDKANWPVRDSNKIKMVGSIVSLAGKYIQEIYGTVSSISIPKSSEGDEDAVAFSANPEFSHPGSPLEVEEFIALNTNKQIALGIKIGNCDGEESFYRIIGSPCAPLKLMVESTDDSEATKDLMKFEQVKKTIELPGRYYGTFTKATATVVAADATTVDVANGEGEYQLTDNTTATVITNLTNAVVGKSYTLVGSGGANPATIDDDATGVLLTADWQGLSGTRITLKAIKHGIVTKFIETSRS
jgi:hypothetical protein